MHCNITHSIDNVSMDIYQSILSKKIEIEKKNDQHVEMKKRKLNNETLKFILLTETA